tara:strand:- start:2095 stop:3042 length:948 start_codon:yes stop_codon:yes gene_type:complete
MRIAVVSDKKSGHLSQCLGLRELIVTYKRDKDIFMLHKDLVVLPGFLERFFTLLNQKLYIFLLKLLNPSLVENKFDFVISSGSRTVFPGYLLSRCSGAKILYIGTPKFRIMKKFDGIISTKSDISKVFKVISLNLPPSKFETYEILKKSQSENLVLLGGDGSGYDYGEKDWYRLAYEFRPLRTTFINSRRTPDFAWKNLQKNSQALHTFLNLENTDFDDLLDAIDTHSNIFVTADSTSMIVEIISRGYFVNVIELRGPIQREHHHEIVENFQREGLLKIISLSELNKSENREFGNVKKFVEKERKDLRDQIYKLL